MGPKLTDWLTDPTTPLEGIKSRIAVLVEYYASLLTNKQFNFSQITGLVTHLSLQLIQTVQDLAGADGAAKKALVLETIDYFYATYLAPLDIPGIPNIIEGSIVDPAIGMSVHRAASLGIDALVQMLNIQAKMFAPIRDPHEVAFGLTPFAGPIGVEGLPGPAGPLGE